MNALVRCSTPSRWGLAVAAWISLAILGTPATGAPGPDVYLTLPPAIDCVPGVEANVYFDNVTLVVNPANCAFDVACDKGMQQAERWTFTPTEKDVGEYPFTLEARDQTNVVIATARSTVKVAPADAGAAGPCRRW